MSNAVAGRQTVHRFTVLGLNKLPAAADDISVVSSRAILTTQPDLTHSVSIVDGSFAVTVDLPDDSAGLDFDIYALVNVQGVETEFTVNLGIVGADIEARMDAQDACLAVIKSHIDGSVPVQPGPVQPGPVQPVQPVQPTKVKVNQSKYPRNCLFLYANGSYIEESSGPVFWPISSDEIDLSLYDTVEFVVIHALTCDPHLTTTGSIVKVDECIYHVVVPLTSTEVETLRSFGVGRVHRFTCVATSSTNQDLSFRVASGLLDLRN